MHENARHRQQILAHLYRVCAETPRRGWLTEYELRNTIGFDEFALVVLEELRLIERDGNRYRITGLGVLEVEEKRFDNGASRGLS